MKERSWKKGVKIGAIALVLLLLGWGVVVAVSHRGQEVPNPSLSVQPAPGGTPPPSLDPDDLPAPPQFNKNGEYVNPQFQGWTPNISEKEWEKIGRARKEAIERRLGLVNTTSGSPSGPPPLPHENFGTIIDVNTDYVISYAGQEVRTDVNLPSGDYLYAPTLYADRSGLESVTFYHGTSTGTERFWCVWNHYQGKCMVTKPFNSDFFQKYVRSYPEGNLYFAQTWRNGKQSRVYLYNFESGKWELPAAIIGTMPYTDGWDIFEIHFYSNTCPALPNIGSDYLSVFDGNSWSDATPSNSHVVDLTDCSSDYQTTVVSPNYHWTTN